MDCGWKTSGRRGSNTFCGSRIDEDNELEVHFGLASS